MRQTVPREPGGPSPLPTSVRSREKLTLIDHEDHGPAPWGHIGSRYAEIRVDRVSERIPSREYNEDPSPGWTVVQTAFTPSLSARNFPAGSPMFPFHRPKWGQGKFRRVLQLSPWCKGYRRKGELEVGGRCRAAPCDTRTAWRISSRRSASAWRARIGQTAPSKLVRIDSNRPALLVRCCPECSATSASAD